MYNRLYQTGQAPVSRDEPNRTRTADRNTADAFPLRRFARCADCGRSLTGSFSRGRNGVRYAFYHCTRSGCSVRTPKAVLEQAFVELLEQLRPHPAYWKLLRADVLDAWRAETASARETSDAARRRVTELEQKRARLDDAFIYRQAIDEATYRAQRDELREATTIAALQASDATSAALDVDGMLTFAEHVLEHAGALWTMETSTPRRIQLQWALFPAGFRVHKEGKIETPVTCLEFFELTPRSLEENGGREEKVDHQPPSWKHAAAWLTTFYALKAA